MADRGGTIVTDSTPALRLRQVTKRFPGTAEDAVSALDLDVKQASIVVLIGPSGCGKTTTLRMINRLIEPTSGRIEIQGEDVTDLPATDLRRGIGYVIQQVGLFPHRTIEANIATVPRTLGWDKARIRSRVEELVEVVGIDHAMLSRYPDELSGGQQQRVGVARALAADPPVLLMDEPFGAVDPIVRARLQDELLALQQRVHKTIVIVTHDIDEAVKLGDRVALFNVGGILEQYGSPSEVLSAPANEFVEEFLGNERGLKMLSLLTPGDLDLSAGCVVPAHARPLEAEQVAKAHGFDWVGILDGDQLRGWAWVADLAELTRVGDAPTRLFRAAVTTTTPLRQVLDGIVNSHTRVAVVLADDQRHLGMITIDDLAEGIQ